MAIRAAVEPRVPKRLILVAMCFPATTICCVDRVMWARADCVVD